MSPATAVAIKCAVFGVGACLASLTVASIDNALTIGEGIAAVSAGWTAALIYAGIGYVTPLEATGKKKGA